MLPDSRQSEALLAIVDTGSFEQAAAQLHLTPSAVSQRLGALEAAVGTPLLIRSRPCRPTSAGQKLVQYLRRSRLLEQEFLAELAADDAQPTAIAVAVNNDTLGTWFLPELSEFLIRENILLDIILDDQDHTYTLLEKGLALAGVSSEPKPMRGCTAQFLGTMRYRMLATPDFVRRWFPNGFTRDAGKKAPLATFDRKDLLQSNFVKKELGLMPGAYPVIYVPASDPFVHAIRLGLGYGMLPVQQYEDMLETGELLDLAPGKYKDVELYWHSWRVQSPKLEKLTEQVIAAAARALGPHAEN
ncbi:LysR family transcriptional regulator ArgP [Pseudoduganella sp. RAF53_2]|jgi:LysR family transcriptional regulator (chromosome initiation inhibitor)|uniref:LysR family transcriptional regulator ArgP n=1 Tax=unclassified Pseudoduganella TaxID=2637179 RepID=UPI003F995890